ncbi:RTA1-like protein [Peniophora sp. CONT]|nr:RTA1-like protein [Peniophora sp. CONT]
MQFPLPLFAALLAPVAVLAKKGNDIPCAPDPFANPGLDPCNPLGYIATSTITSVAFALIVACAVVQTIMMWRWGARWMACMVIGEYTFAIGIGSRWGLHTMPDSKSIYIVEYLFVVLSPCAFIAADYILLGRLARHLRAGQHLLIPPTKIMIVFVVSDITTFLIQAAGGGVSIAANTAKVNKVGSNIFLAGLAIQLASFVTFTVVYLRFLWLVWRREPATWSKDTGLVWWRDWRALASALGVSCVGIIIRSFYRVVELSQGFKGSIARNEALFYGLDTLPLFIAFIIYIGFWPGRFISPLTLAESSAAEVKDSEHTPRNATPNAYEKRASEEAGSGVVV